MLRIAILALCAASAHGYAAPVARSVRSAARRVAPVMISDAQMLGPETSGKKFDPLKLSELGSEETLNFFKAAEIKHGRVAMAAFVGWLVAVNHIHFPGMLSSDISFEELSKLSPLAQWDAMPLAGKVQIIGTIGFIEHQSELLGKHYMKGGKPGDLTGLGYYFDPLGTSKKLTQEQKDKKMQSELKNGRLAMIGIISCFVGSSVQGSIPLDFFPGVSDGPLGVLPFGSF